MNIIEKNKQWMKFYSAVSRILGWAIILLVAIKVFFLLKMSFEIVDRQIVMRNIGTIFEATFNRIPVGILLLGVSQLFKYIYEDEYKVPWLLRNGTKILYLFTGLVISCPFISYLYYHGRGHTQYLISILGFSLILIGLGNILKRVIPIIEEYKSLV